MNPDSDAAKSRLEGRWGLVVVIIIVAIVVVAFVISALTYSAGPDITATGKMYVSSSGEWNGTETAEYEVSLEFKDGEGMLTISLLNGNFDPVENKTMKVFSITEMGDDYNLETEAGLLQFVKYHIEDPDVFNGTAIEAYVALWSEGKNIGEINPNLFGMPESYFVAMALEER